MYGSRSVCSALFNATFNVVLHVSRVFGSETFNGG